MLKFQRVSRGWVVYFSSIRKLVTSFGVIALLTGCPQQESGSRGSAGLGIQLAPGTSSTMSGGNNVPKVSPQNAPTGSNVPAVSATSTAVVNGNVPFLFNLVDMPFYDQNSSALGSTWFPNGTTQTQLCAPAAVAMALAAVLNKVRTIEAPYSLPASSWTARNFDTANEEGRILAAASLMQTSPTAGTLFGTAANSYISRASDFTVAGHPYSAGSIKNFLAAVDATQLTNAINPGNSLTATVPVVMYGHYLPDANPTVVGGKSFYLYRRKGGHFIALPGYQKDSFGTRFEVHDPLDKNILKLYQVVTFSNTSNVADRTPSGTDSANPLTDTSRYTALNGLGYLTPISSPTYYAIVEGYSTLSVPLR